MDFGWFYNSDFGQSKKPRVRWPRTGPFSKNPQQGRVGNFPPTNGSVQIDGFPGPLLVASFRSKHSNSFRINQPTEGHR